VRGHGQIRTRPGETRADDDKAPEGMPVSSTRDGHLEYVGESMARFARMHDVSIDPSDVLSALAHAGYGTGRLRRPPLTALAYALGPRFGAVRFDARRRGARRFGARPRRMSPSSLATRLAAQRLPVLVSLDADYRLITHVDREGIALRPLDAPDAMRLSFDRFVAAWDGEAVVRLDPAHRPGVPVGWASILARLTAHRGVAAQALVAAFAAQMLSLATPVFFQVTIDRVLVHEAADTLTVLTVLFVGLAGLESLFGFLRGHLTLHAATRMELELSARVYEHVLRLPLTQHARMRTAQTIANAREIEIVRHFLAGASLPTIVELAFTVVFLALMSLYSIALTAIVALAFVVQAGVAVAALRPTRTRLAQRTEAEAAQSSLLIESIEAIETVKAATREAHCQRRYEDALAARILASRRVGTFANALSQCGLGLARVTTALILWRGALLVMEGTLTLGQLVACNLLAARVMAPQLKLASFLAEFERAALAVRRVAAVTALPAESEFGCLPALPARGELAFRDVTFTYPGRDTVTLKDVSFDVRRGEIIAIVGPEGAGKSTLARLAAGLYRPTAGAVTVDGVDLKDLAPTVARRLVSVVGPNPAIIRGTVAENVSMGGDHEGSTRVMAACRAAGADAFVRALPDGYATRIGEDGIGLSGGERRRLALARALGSGARVLVVDDTESGLDPAGQARLARILRAQAAERAVILVTHRLALARGADRVLVLAAGRVREAGSHETLVARGGLYADLWRSTP